MARSLGLSYPAFLRTYAWRTDQGWSLREKEKPNEHGWDCVFLDRDSQPGKALCSIHAVRPRQCRTFPFWPEILASRRAWQKTARLCEGIGRGPLIPADQVRLYAREGTGFCERAD
jgi:Fe-S-cluster containining protein